MVSVAKTQTKYIFTNDFYLGTSVTSDLTSNTFSQYEQKSEWVKLQMTYLTDLKLKDQRLNVKIGLRPLNLKKQEIELFIFLPYLNMDLKSLKYNTPFSFEVTWKNHLQLILDTGLKDVQIQIRYRTKIF